RSLRSTGRSRQRRQISSGSARRRSNSTADKAPQLSFPQRRRPVNDDRDFIGYGADPPDPQWPGGARVAVNINLNFEGGGERSLAEGDAASQGALNDIGQPALPGFRSPLVESVFEHGSR